MGADYLSGSSWRLHTIPLTPGNIVYSLFLSFLFSLFFWFLSVFFGSDCLSFPSFFLCFSSFFSSSFYLQHKQKSFDNITSVNLNSIFNYNNTTSSFSTSIKPLLYPIEYPKRAYLFRPLPPSLIKRYYDLCNWTHSWFSPFSLLLPSAN